MQQLVCTIGKWKSGAEKSLFELYVKRSRWPVELREMGGYATLQPDQQRKRETELLIATAKEWGAQHSIMLDETGKALSSRALAACFQQWQDAGARKIAWIIGGDVGLDKSLLNQSDMALSLGAMTWPHLLVRALLAEQIYRVQTIIAGHPYHRD